MKRSWISIVGFVLTVFFIYLSYAYRNSLAEAPISLPFLFVSLIYFIFGFRQRFQNSMVKISLVIFAIIGGFFLISDVFKIYINSNAMFIFFLATASIGFFCLFGGIIWWIYDEIKGRALF